MEDNSSYRARIMQDKGDKDIQVTEKRRGGYSAQRSGG
jgi:hypothetical protein